jgi:CRISPR-associated protein Cmr4
MPKQLHTEYHFLLRALSNLHPGSGDNAFGLIDRIVQRDPTNGLPVIFSSSLKGSLRELANFKNPPKLKDPTNPKAGYEEHPLVQTIFGSDNRRGKAAHLQQGNHVFFDAHLLALPVRASHRFYFLATTPTVVQDFLDHSGTFLTAEQASALKSLADTDVAKGKPFCYGGDAGEVYLENLLATRQEAPEGFPSLMELIGDRLALLHPDDFADRCEELPTVARNALNNGISENLWYEEIVPREARFYTRFVDTTGGQGPHSLTGLLQTANHEVQVGANATVGYGLTRWTPLKKA